MMSTDKKSRNLIALQADDVMICDIAEEVAHVEVYKFDPASAKWDKMGVAGTGFIVVRSSNDPKFRFQVLNKSGLHNFALDVDKISKIKEQSPYIMLKCTLNGVPVILGLWVHDEKERNQLLKSLSAAMAGKLTVSSAPASTNSTKSTSSTSSSSSGSSSSSSGTDILKSVLKSPAAVGAKANVAIKVGTTQQSPAPQQQQQSRTYAASVTGAATSATSVFRTDREISNNINSGKLKTPPISTIAVAGAASGNSGKVKALSLQESMSMFHGSPNAGVNANANDNNSPVTPSQKMLQSFLLKSNPNKHSQQQQSNLLLSPSDITGVRRKFLKDQ